MSTENRELISQADAARLRGVSRQRIEQLIKSGRLTPIQDLKYGRSDKRKIMLDREEVLNLQDGNRGRPKLSDTEKRERAFRHGFFVGQNVTYKSHVRDYSIAVEAVIVKSGQKRIKIEFEDATGQRVQSWVRPEDIEPMSEPTPYFEELTVELDEEFESARAGVYGE